MCKTFFKCVKTCSSVRLQTWIVLLDMSLRIRIFFLNHIFNFWNSSRLQCLSTLYLQVYQRHVDYWMLLQSADAKKRDIWRKCFLLSVLMCQMIILLQSAISLGYSLNLGIMWPDRPCCHGMDAICCLNRHVCFSLYTSCSYPIKLSCSNFLINMLIYNFMLTW